MEKSRITTMTLVALALIAVAGSVWAADPVNVTVALTEDSPAAVPGATVKVKATVTINDGSTLTSIMWAQAGGVPATLADVETDTVSATLGSVDAYKDHLTEALREPGGHEVEGGLQSRFEVAGISPFALEEGGLVVFDITVVTSSGTYHPKATNGTVPEIITALPWVPQAGIRNVPIFAPVLLNGKEQDAYSWAMTVPPGSTATLHDATTRYPYFTPDLPGTYQLTVSDATGAAPVVRTVLVVAGTWKGVITGQDGNGRPVPDTACTRCHAAGTPLDAFTPWKNSGHAEIFTQNVNVAGHYSTSCMSCHSVGLDGAAANNGIDDQADWAGLVASGLIEHGAPGNWTTILATYPASARFANIQCENCHGPQNSGAHISEIGLRQSLGSDMCGTCHGEPPRHGRFQQWQGSGHGNYELAREEGTNGSCSKCHSAQGFVQWANAGFGSAAINVTWTTDEVHPQTCATCHDPHAVGTTSGSDATNATVRIDGDTPMLDAGFIATGLGKGAVCATCHNSRRGLRNDSQPLSDPSRAPHVGTQADLLAGQNLYFVEVGKPSYHSMVQDSCVACHMEQTAPPLDYSLNANNGTNHAFTAAKTICANDGCHKDRHIVAEDVQEPIEAQIHALTTAIETAITGTLKAQLDEGMKVKLGSAATAPVLTSSSEVASVALFDASGRQAIQVTKADGSTVPASPVGLNNVSFVPPAGAAKAFYALADTNIAKAAWNLFVVETDGSLGVHNPGFAKAALDVALFAAKNAKTTPAAKSETGGGPGMGYGAVACTTEYVYWAEIAAHNPGANGTQWRTDIVARNLASADATLGFYLHQATGDPLHGTGTVVGGSQNAFEDIVTTLGGTNNKGALEICSDKPLLVNGRMFNQAANGTFGQLLEGHVADLGYSAGDAVQLIGLRQLSTKFRTNLSVTNGGKTDAEVTVDLYDATGANVESYSLTVKAGKVVQDLEPFKNRAEMADLGWGFAKVTVVTGSNVQTSASVIDAKTGDATTVLALQ